MRTTDILDVRGLRIIVGTGREVVSDLSFALGQGETLAIVGESGSGKTLTALSIAGLLPANASVVGGTIRFEGEDIRNAPSDALRRLRGERIAYVFQEPMTSLNPVLSIGRQMTEGFLAHRRMTLSAARERAAGLLERVGIADPERRLAQFPHELSGGMRQRVMIAMAMMSEPSLIVADEPTTALDVTIQAQVLDLLRALTAEAGTSLLLITHDMGVVAEMADRVLVMRDGRAVEEGRAVPLFAAPRHSYTRALLAAVPRLEGASPADGNAKGGTVPVLAAEGVGKTFGGRRLFGAGRTRALDGVSLDVMPGETVALVGESGSGKSTLGRALARLVAIDEGIVRVEGEDMAHASGTRLRRMRAKVQMIFQDPYASLDPRFSIAGTVAEPILVHARVGRAEARTQAEELLLRVGLDKRTGERYPHELSGGQRQRVAIARALAVRPKVIVADEPTSALDVSIQARILELLAELRAETGIAMLFISHDFAVVRRIASRVAVMRRGRILEIGPTGMVLGSPRHPYTRALLSAVPATDPALRGRARITVDAAAYPSGRLFEAGDGHWVAS